jgi:hypothetical protein
MAVNAKERPSCLKFDPQILVPKFKDLKPSVQSKQSDVSLSRRHNKPLKKTETKHEVVKQEMHRTEKPKGGNVDVTV